MRACGPLSLLGKAGWHGCFWENTSIMAELAALIFDFDGTIAETERDGHRVAYNRAFTDARAAWTWDVPTYGALLAIAGGKERLTAFLSRERPDIVEPERSALVSRLHEAKRHHFDRLASELAFRPGVVRLVAEARAAGIRCAIATTAAPSGVDALLRRDSVFAASFEVIVAGDMVPHKKPAPDIYLLALERLGIDAERAVAFEDSHVGLRAAIRRERLLDHRGVHADRRGQQARIPAHGRPLGWQLREPTDSIHRPSLVGPEQRRHRRRARDRQAGRGAR